MSETVSHAETCPVSRPGFIAWCDDAPPPPTYQGCNCDFGARLEAALTKERERRFRVKFYSPVIGREYLLYRSASVPPDLRTTPGSTRTFIIADDSGDMLQLVVESLD